MRLSRRIAEAGLSPEVARAFAQGLRAVAEADGVMRDEEVALIDHLLAGQDADDAEPAAFDALWPHGELFLTACLYVAVADGDYGIEEARVVSEFAHRLGYSAHRLAQLEARVFHELQERAVRQREREGKRAPSPPSPRRVAEWITTTFQVETESGRIGSPDPKAPQRLRPSQSQMPTPLPLTPASAGDSAVTEPLGIGTIESEPVDAPQPQALYARRVESHEPLVETPLDEEVTEVDASAVDAPSRSGNRRPERPVLPSVGDD